VLRVPPSRETDGQHEVNRLLPQPVAVQLLLETVEIQPQEADRPLCDLLALWEHSGLDQLDHELGLDLLPPHCLADVCTLLDQPLVKSLHQSELALDPLDHQVGKKLVVLLQQSYCLLLCNFQASPQLLLHVRDKLFLRAAGAKPAFLLGGLHYGLEQFRYLADLACDYLVFEGRELDPQLRKQIPEQVPVVEPGARGVLLLEGPERRRDGLPCPFEDGGEQLGRFDSVDVEGGVQGVRAQVTEDEVFEGLW
jgi:hypothetical protein